jgi:hypothetical protein
VNPASLTTTLSTTNYARHRYAVGLLLIAPFRSSKRGVFGKYDLQRFQAFLQQNLSSEKRN